MTVPLVTLTCIRGSSSLANAVSLRLFALSLAVLFHLLAHYFRQSLTPSVIHSDLWQDVSLVTVIIHDFAALLSPLNLAIPRRR